MTVSPRRAALRPRSADQRRHRIAGQRPVAAKAARSRWKGARSSRRATRRRRIRFAHCSELGEALGRAALAGGAAQIEEDAAAMVRGRRCRGSRNGRPPPLRWARSAPVAPARCRRASPYLPAARCGPPLAGGVVQAHREPTGRWDSASPASTRSRASIWSAGGVERVGQQHVARDTSSFERPSPALLMPQRSPARPMSETRSCARMERTRAGLARWGSASSGRPP